jgi:hypothetical protein
MVATMNSTEPGATPAIELVLTFNSLDDDEEHQDALVRQIADTILEAGGDLGEATRPHEIAPPGSKGVGAALMGVLRVVIDPQRIRALFNFLVERLSARPVALEVAANGRILRITAGSAAELSAAVAAATRFVEGVQAAPQTPPPGE